MINNQGSIPLLLTDEPQNFPDPTLALIEPNGLLAIGGRLSSKQLIIAYQSGVFPWFTEQDPILWWSPTPRTLLIPTEFKCTRSLKKSLKKNITLTCDIAFEEVINQCRTLREQEGGTWITEQMVNSYSELHEQGVAHSIEVWHEGTLVGGLYGISIGHAFFGESMFHKQSDASKIALMRLCNLPLTFDFIDCQMPTSHLHSMGAIDCSRAHYLIHLKQTLSHASYREKWLFDPISGTDLLNLSLQPLANKR